MYVSIGPEMLGNVSIREHIAGKQLCVDLYHEGKLVLMTMTYDQANNLSCLLDAWCRDNELKQRHKLAKPKVDVASPDGGDIVNDGATNGQHTDGYSHGG